MRIWFALLAAPMLALADQIVSYASVGWACGHPHPIVLHSVHAVFLVVAAGSIVPAWQLWSATRGATPGDESRKDRHFLAGLATASAAVSVLVIVAMWMPTWVIAPCFN